MKGLITFLVFGTLCWLGIVTTVALQERRVNAEADSLRRVVDSLTIFIDTSCRPQVLTSEAFKLECYIVPDTTKGKNDG